MINLDERENLSDLSGIGIEAVNRAVFLGLVLVKRRFISGYFAELGRFGPFWASSGPSGNYPSRF